MTLLFNQTCPEFDEDPALEAGDRAQPLAVEPSDAFVVLRQRDGGGPDQIHCIIIIERCDVQALIEALMRS